MKGDGQKPSTAVIGGSNLFPSLFNFLGIVSTIVQSPTLSYL